MMFVRREMQHFDLTSQTLVASSHGNILLLYVKAHKK